MSWPQGKGYAPRHSREVEKASEAMRSAEQTLREALQEAYPWGTPVRVIHHRGEFTGKVIGWDHQGSRVKVLNDRSEKAQKWWAVHVELIDGQRDAAQGVES